MHSLYYGLMENSSYQFVGGKIHSTHKAKADGNTHDNTSQPYSVFCNI